MRTHPFTKPAMTVSTAIGWSLREREHTAGECTSEILKLYLSSARVCEKRKLGNCYKTKVCQSLLYMRAPTLFLHLHIRFLARATEIRDKIRLNTTTGQFTSTYATFSALPQLPTLGHPCSIILWLSTCTCSSSVCSNTSRPCSPRMTRAYNDLSDPPFAMHTFSYQCN